MAYLLNDTAVCRAVPVKAHWYGCKREQRESNHYLENEYKVDVYLRIPRPCLSPTVVSSVSKRPENQTGGE